MSSNKRRDIPRFDTPIIETHCHLDYLDDDTLGEVLRASRDAGVERIITIAVSPDNLHRVLALSRADAMIWATQGVHPHEAESFEDSVEASIRNHATDARVVAIGEIGLDYHYDHADRAVQRRVFARQLRIAAELDLPVVIHTRDADDDTRDILREHAAALSRKGVIHSFTSGMALAEFCLAEGFLLGFNGIATFKAADNVRQVIAATPLDRLVLETDAPYLTPVPYRGRPNAPCFLPFIAEAVALARSVEVEELLRLAHRNSMELFFPGG